MSEQFETLVGHLKSELVQENRDPGVWLDPRGDAREIRIQTSNAGEGWCVFSLSDYDLEDRNLRTLALEMVQRALDGCGKRSLED